MSRLTVHGSRLSLALTKEGPLATASQPVYASSAVCYAYCMAPQFPSDKRAQPAPESVPVRAQSNQSTASAHVGSADCITSRDNKWLKQFRAALRGTGPAEGEPIAAEGPKLVEEGVRSGLETEALLVSENGERHLERILLAASESDSGVPRSRIFRTSDKLFESVAGTEAPQGVAALFRQHEWSFDDVMRGRANFDGAYRGDLPLIVVMAAVQDPGNVGTIVRSAEAFGASGVVGTRGAADPWSPKALRASAGSALRVPLLRGMAIPILLAQLRVAGVRILAAGSRPNATAAARDAGTPIPDMRSGCAIFIGNEGAGLPSEAEHAADDWISIAMNEDVESLNAGVAASVILFEAARQRRGA
ncbi:MAG: RNA methyltransferase [Candidatus Acidiferrales bacterium]